MVVYNCGPFEKITNNYIIIIVIKKKDAFRHRFRSDKMYLMDGWAKSLAHMYRNDSTNTCS